MKLSLNASIPVTGRGVKNIPDEIYLTCASQSHGCKFRRLYSKHGQKRWPDCMKGNDSAVVLHTERHNTDATREARASKTSTQNLYGTVVSINDYCVCCSLFTRTDYALSKFPWCSLSVIFQICFTPLLLSYLLLTLPKEVIVMVALNHLKSSIVVANFFYHNLKPGILCDVLFPAYHNLGTGKTTCISRLYIPYFLI